MAALTKTTSVLHRIPGPVVGTFELFQSIVDEPGDRVTTTGIDHDVWVELGEPEQITVTVEPGDRLNED